MTDRSSGPAGRHPEQRRHDQRPDVDDEHRRLHVERGRRAAARHHLARASSCARLSRTLTTLEHMERYGDTGQYYNWYDHRTGAKLTDWPPKPDHEFHPILSSVDNGWLAVGPEDRARTASRPLRSRARRALRRDGLRLLLPARRQPGAVPLPARTTPPPRPAATTPSSARAGSSTTSASRAASCRRRSTTAAGAPSRTPATTPSRRPSRSGRGAHYFGVDVFEGAYPYNGTRLVPVVGRLDVRGADARPVRPGGELGAATAGARTTRSRWTRRSTTA